MSTHTIRQRLSRVLVGALFIVSTGCQPNPLAPTSDDTAVDATTGSQVLNVFVNVHDHPAGPSSPDQPDEPDANRPPMLTSPGNQTSAAGDAISLVLLASDPDGDALTWFAGGLPRGLAIDQASGVISGAISSSSALDSPFITVVMVTDPSAASASASFLWTVTEP